MHKLGKDLKAGDTIKVWWYPGQDTIVKIKPYDGPLNHLFPEGAQLTKFLILKGGMTIDNSETYELCEEEAW